MSYIISVALPYIEDIQTQKINHVRICFSEMELISYIIVYDIFFFIYYYS